MKVGFFSELLGVTPQTITNWRREGMPYSYDGCYLYNKSSLEWYFYKKGDSCTRLLHTIALYGHGHSFFKYNSRLWDCRLVEKGYFNTFRPRSHHKGLRYKDWLVKKAIHLSCKHNSNKKMKVVFFSELLGVTPQTITNWRREGMPYSYDGCYLYNKSSLEWYFYKKINYEKDYILLMTKLKELATIIKKNDYAKKEIFMLDFVYSRV
jgi:hypothetical protein